jgi:hypothetical protein
MSKVLFWEMQIFNQEIWYYDPSLPYERGSW